MSRTSSSAQKSVVRPNRAGLMGHHIVHGRGHVYGQSPPSEVIAIPHNEKNKAQPRRRVASCSYNKYTPDVSLSSPRAQSVHGRSPRSTSMLYQYYNSPRGYFYQNQKSVYRRPPSWQMQDGSKTPVGRSYSCSGPSCRANYSNTDTTTSTYDTDARLPKSFHSEKTVQPRMRSYSESDEKKAESRMSKFEKLRRRISYVGRSSSTKKRKPIKSEADTSEISGCGSFREDSNNNYSSTQKGGGECGSCTSAERYSCVLDTFPRLGIGDGDHSNSDALPLDPETDLVYQRFLEEHTCYDIMPTSCKVVVFDCRMHVRKAFNALLESNHRSAPIWDSIRFTHIGMLTITDYIDVIVANHRASQRTGDPPSNYDSETITGWRRILNQHQDRLLSVSPDHNLLQSVQFLYKKRLHSVPISKGGQVFHMITHKRLLRFIHLFINEIPMPDFVKQSLEDSGIGKFNEDVTTITKEDTLLRALEIISDQKFTAIPVVNERGHAVDIFCKLDMIQVAAQTTNVDVSLKMGQVLAARGDESFYSTTSQDENKNNVENMSSPKHDDQNVNNSTSVTMHGNSPIVKKSCRHSVSSPGQRRRQLTSHYPQSARWKRASESEQDFGYDDSDVGIGSNSSSTAGYGGREPCRRTRSLPAESNSTSQYGFPLIKCRLSDTILDITNRLLSTKGNMIVVTRSERDDTLIGVVTVTDVLAYLVDPKGHLNIHNNNSSSRHTATEDDDLVKSSSKMNPSSRNLSYESGYGDSVRFERCGTSHSESNDSCIGIPSSLSSDGAVFKENCSPTHHHQSYHDDDDDEDNDVFCGKTTPSDDDRTHTLCDEATSSSNCTATLEDDDSNSYRFYSGGSSTTSDSTSQGEGNSELAEEDNDDSDGDENVNYIMGKSEQIKRA